MRPIDLSAATFTHAPLDRADLDFAEETLAAIHASAALAREQGTLPDDGEGRRHTSVDALAEAMASDDDRSDMRTDPGMATCLVFHTGGLPGSMVDERVTALRRRVDAGMNDLVRNVLVGIGRATAAVSGHLFYPPGAYLGWHTNVRVPGWRAYLTYAEEPERSFFRYRDPTDGEVVTSWDTGWDLRVFWVDPLRPLWHAVYSDTNRFSFGYRLVTESGELAPGPASAPTGKAV
jgi:hypothetical protein